MTGLGLDCDKKIKDVITIHSPLIDPFFQTISNTIICKLSKSKFGKICFSNILQIKQGISKLLFFVGPFSYCCQVSITKHTSANYVGRFIHSFKDPKGRRFGSQPRQNFYLLKNEEK